jgi:hypothetical protein
MLGAGKAGHLLSLPAFEGPPLVNQGLDAFDQAPQLATGNPVGRVNHLIHVTSEVVHFLKSRQQPEIHRVQADSGGSFQGEVLLDSSNLQANRLDYLLSGIHSALVSPASGIGILQSLEAVDIKRRQLL